MVLKSNSPQKVWTLKMQPYFLVWRADPRLKTQPGGGCRRGSIRHGDAHGDRQQQRPHGRNATGQRVQLCGHSAQAHSGHQVGCGQLHWTQRHQPHHCVSVQGMAGGQQGSPCLFLTSMQTPVTGASVSGVGCSSACMQTPCSMSGLGFQKVSHWFMCVQLRLATVHSCTVQRYALCSASAHVASTQPELGLPSASQANTGRGWVAATKTAVGGFTARRKGGQLC